MSGGCSLVAAHGPLAAVASCCRAQSLRARAGSVQEGGSSLQNTGLSSCGARIRCSTAAVGSSCTRAWTCVSCIDRQIFYHWATRKSLTLLQLENLNIVEEKTLWKNKYQPFLSCWVTMWARKGNLTHRSRVQEEPSFQGRLCQLSHNCKLFSILWYGFHFINNHIPPKMSLS